MLLALAASWQLALNSLRVHGVGTTRKVVGIRVSRSSSSSSEPAQWRKRLLMLLPLRRKLKPSQPTEQAAAAAGSRSATRS